MVFFFCVGEKAHNFVSTNKNETQNFKHMKTKTIFRSLAVLAVSTLTSVAAFAQPISLQVSYTNPTCNGLSNGEVLIDITGGSEPYYVNGILVTGTQFIAGNLAEGNFTFNVTDDINNNTSADVTLVAPQALNVQGVVSNVTTYGGNNGLIDVTVSNVPVTFNWNTPNGSGLVAGVEDQSGLTAGVYNLTLTESNGCETIRRFIVGEPVNPANYMNSSYTPNTQGSTGGTTLSGN